MKSIFVTTFKFLLMAMCFIPEIAEARLKGSGIGDGTIDVTNFELDTSLNSYEGIFDNALTLYITRSIGCSLNCNLLFSNGRITASPIKEEDLTAFGLVFSDLNNNDKDRDGIPNSEEIMFYDPSNEFDFSNGGVKYETTFLGSDTKAIFFVPLPDSNPLTLNNYITSLSNLESITRLQLIVSGFPNSAPTQPILNRFFGFNTFFNPLKTVYVSETTSVPENHTVVSFICVAGGLLFLKVYPGHKKNLS